MALEDDEELSRDGNENGFRGLVPGTLPVAHGGEDDDTSGGAEGANAERFAGVSLPAPYASGASACSAFSGMGSDAGQRGDLAAAQAVELG